MSTTIWRNTRPIKALMRFVGILFCILMFYSCANRKPALGATFYRFEYNGENYRIRSVASRNNALSFNELISKKFVAKDYDQDGLIDEITLGKIDLSEAQKIYEYSLTMLTTQNKLHEVNPKINVYQHADSEYHYEIKSFRPSNAEPFNQFKIFKNGRILNPQITICIDHKADGTLDEIVKGTLSIEKSQTLYSDVIKKGLERNELIEIEHMILVKQN